MKKAAAMRPPLWVIYCNRFYMGASPGIPPAPPWCGGNTVSAGRGSSDPSGTHGTRQRTTQHRSGTHKRRLENTHGKGQLVNVFAGQPAPLEIFTSAGVQRGFIAFPAGSEDFSGSGGGVIAADRDILEHGPVKAKILTVGAVVDTSQEPKLGPSRSWATAAARSSGTGSAAAVSCGAATGACAGVCGALLRFKSATASKTAATIKAPPKAL